MLKIRGIVDGDLLAACDVYGGRFCASCGEDNCRFLTIDHVAGGGNKLRGGKRIKVATVLRKLGFPSGYQILCWNCNIGKAKNGNVLVCSDSIYVCDSGCLGKICRHGFTHDQRYGRRRFLAVLGAYGGAQCVCCGETNPFFLTLDHINDNGADHRRVIGVNTAQWAWSNGCPQDVGLRVMCANCNSGREFNGGICPHKS